MKNEMNYKHLIGIAVMFFLLAIIFLFGYEANSNYALFSMMLSFMGMSAGVTARVIKQLEEKVKKLEEKSQTQELIEKHKKEENA